MTDQSPLVIKAAEFKEKLIETAREEAERATKNYWTTERVAELLKQHDHLSQESFDGMLSANTEFKRLLARGQAQSAEMMASEREAQREALGKNGAVYLDFSDGMCVRTKYFNAYKRADPFTVKGHRASDVVEVDMAGKGWLASLFFEAKLMASVTNSTFEAVCKAPRGNGGIGAPWFWKDLCNLFEYEKENGRCKSAFQFSTIEKALNITQGTTGGIWLPELFHTQVIELARVRSSFLLAGPRLMNVPENGIKMATETGEAGAAYYAENAQVNSSQLSVGTREISPQRLASLTSFSNAAIRTGALDVRFIRDNVTRKHATTIDEKALQGAGGSNEISGLITQGIVSVAAVGGSTAANMMTDSKALRRQIAINNHSVERMTVWLSIRTADAMHGIENTGGNYPFMEMIDRGRLPRNQTMFESNHIPTNLGGGSESRMIGAAMDHVIWATAPEAAQLKVGAFTYPDASGDLQSAEATDTSALYLQEKHDLFLEYPDAAGQVTAVPY